MDHKPDVEQIIERNRPAANELRERGMERGILGIINTCAWYLSWNDARQQGDATAVVQALTVMTDVLPGYARELGGPEPEKAYRDTARKAGLGDPTDALSFVKANCEWMLSRQSRAPVGSASAVPSK